MNICLMCLSLALAHASEAKFGLLVFVPIDSHCTPTKEIWHMRVVCEGLKCSPDHSSISVLMCSIVRIQCAYPVMCFWAQCSHHAQFVMSNWTNPTAYMKIWWKFHIKAVSIMEAFIHNHDNSGWEQHFPFCVDALVAECDTGYWF